MYFKKLLYTTYSIKKNGNLSSAAQYSHKVDEKKKNDKEAVNVIKFKCLFVLSTEKDRE